MNDTTPIQVPSEHAISESGMYVVEVSNKTHGPYKHYRTVRHYSIAMAAYDALGNLYCRKRVIKNGKVIARGISDIVAA